MYKGVPTKECKVDSLEMPSSLCAYKRERERARTRACVRDRERGRTRERMRVRVYVKVSVNCRTDAQTAKHVK